MNAPGTHPVTGRPLHSWELLRDGFAFPEGPTLLRNGELIWTDAPSGRVLTAGLVAGMAEPAAVPARILGTAERADGEIVVACADPPGIAVIGPDGLVRTIDLAPFGIRLVNDLAVGAHGEIYFTDSGAEADGFVGGLWRLEGDTPIAVCVPLHYANGVVWDAARSRILVAETSHRRIVTLDTADISAPPSVFATMTGGVGPDGLALDESGNLYVAHYGAGRIRVFASDGTALGSIPAPGENPTNLTFDPASGALFLTEAETGGIWRLPADPPDEPGGQA